MSGVRVRVLALVVGVSLGCEPGTSEPTVTPSEPAAPRSPTTSASPANDDDAAPLRIREVAPGVFAALQPAPRRFADSNAAVLVSEAGAVVIDGPQQVATARWLGQQVDAMTEGTERILVTTHWHLDHSLGSTVLRAALEDREIPLQHWGHAALGEQLRTEGATQLREHREGLVELLARGEAMRESGARSDGTPLTEDERAQLDRELAELRRQQQAVAGLELAEPTHPVQEVTSVRLGSLEFELHPVRAHTVADVVIYVPAAKVLVTGDVLDELPFGGHGYPRQWLAVLQRLSELPVETIIPGHGAPMGPEAIDQVITLWTAILEQAEHAIAKGQTAAERYAEWEQTEGFDRLRTRFVTDPVSGRAWAAFMPESLARAMAEPRGER